ncbi:hypothetical protein FDG94_gp077 [Pseudomonas phage SM1]|uniref:Uncharacterized protein n=2 Tax=Samunavirus TaxID=2560221 RepID=A0A0U2KZ45_9CAUD|nr:hypothetical protein FDG94_gp077 [Pseudomonas phage SM1]ALT58069.1 hypothetical protein SM1_077 [Pseudomonas phage SM1]WDS62494.1 hypothetical protein UFRH6_66 [Pseudomonas phage UF_RH6]HBO9768493.1 hypothetical protein [Pseudomonas aeruginosa]
MSKFIIEWGRLDETLPTSVPMATAMFEVESLSGAFRMVGSLAHTLTTDRVEDSAVLSNIYGCVAHRFNSALKANGRAVFWGARDDWFISITNRDKHPLDGGYRSVAQTKVKAKWMATLSLRREFPLKEQTRKLVQQLIAEHERCHSYCEGDCRMGIAIRDAEIALNAMESPL